MNVLKGMVIFGREMLVECVILYMVFGFGN